MMTSNEMKELVKLGLGLEIASNPGKSLFVELCEIAKKSGSQITVSSTIIPDDWIRHALRVTGIDPKSIVIKLTP